MLIPDRHHELESYRYGFNGMEVDDELKGEGNSYDFGARMYDSRIARWMSADPLEIVYPSHSSYSYVGLNLVNHIEVDGRYWITLLQRSDGNYYSIRIVDHKAIEAADFWGVFPIISWATIVMKTSQASQDPSYDLSAGDWVQLVGAGVLKPLKNAAVRIGKLTNLEEKILGAGLEISDLTMTVIDNPDMTELIIEKQVILNLALIIDDVGWIERNDEGVILEGLLFKASFIEDMFETVSNDLGFSETDLMNEVNKALVFQEIENRIGKMMEAEKEKVRKTLESEMEQIDNEIE